MPLLFDFIYRQFIHTPPDVHTSFKDKTVIVTGSNVGLGKEACRKLVRNGAAQVIMACRNEEKGRAAAADLQATTAECGPGTLQVWALDLSSYASVVGFAERANRELARLDAVLGNAGLMSLKFNVTEGDEEVITTNVVSCALLGFLLYPKLRQTAAAFSVQTHFTVTSSELYEQAKFKELKAPEGQLFATLADKSFKPSLSDRYNISKLMISLVVREMAAMVPVEGNNVIINSVAPGYCYSSLGRQFGEGMTMHIIMKILARPTEVGARTLVYGAAAGPPSHGQYLPDEKITPLVGLAKGPKGDALQARIWAELKPKLEAIRPGVTDIGGK